MRVTKAQKIKHYNIDNPTYHITNVKKLTAQALEYYKNDYKSLDDLYKSYSNLKRASWQNILRDYQPRTILGMSGNSMTYSVMLVANNGDVLHITRENNWLVEVV